MAGNTPLPSERVTEAEARIGAGPGGAVVTQKHESKHRPCQAGHTAGHLSRENLPRMLPQTLTTEGGSAASHGSTLHH